MPPLMKYSALISFQSILSLSNPDIFLHLNEIEFIFMLKNHEF